MDSGHNGSGTGQTMNLGSSHTAERVLRDATGCPTASEAIAWLAEGHHLQDGADPHQVLRSLTRLSSAQTDVDGPFEDALERLVREVSESDLDTARVLIDVEDAPSPSQYRDALETLKRKSPNGQLDGLTVDGVFAAQTLNRFCIETLCAVAGVTYNNLRDWADASLPRDPSSQWSKRQVGAAFEVIRDVVEGLTEPDLPNTRRARPIELLLVGEDAPSGWYAVEEMDSKGVDYAVLLAQRAAGSAWGTHRNRKSQRVSEIVAAKLIGELDGRELDYHLTWQLGGPINKAGLREMTGVDSHIGLVVLDEGQVPAFAVVLQVANDGGTARKTAGSLIKEMENPTVPTALLVAGAGWSGRNESAGLAKKFDGLIFSDRDVTALVDTIEEAVSTTEREAR